MSPPERQPERQHEPTRARRALRFLGVVLASTVLLIALGAWFLGAPEWRTIVLAACAWFTAHLVVVFAWLARARPEEPVFAVYARVSALWLLVLVLRLAADAAPDQVLTDLSRMARLWFLCGCVDLVVRVTGHAHRHVGRGLLALAAAAVLVPLAGLHDADLATRVFTVEHLALRLLGIVVVILLVARLWRGPQREAQILLGSGLVIMAVGADFFWSRFFPGALFSHLTTPVIGVAMALLLVSRLLEATRAAESLATNLEATVAARTLELQRRHQDVLELERRRALQDERERLMRDMHDGAGGELVAALALLDGDGPEARDELRERLRKALLELRLMIDSLDDLEGDLTGLLAGFRTRMQPVLDAAGLTSRWRLDALPPLDGLGPRAALDVLRILQEALTNTLRHAGADAVAVRATAVGDHIHLEVEDNGRGFDPAVVNSGRGLTNMQTRAARLGGALQVERLERGTRVRLTLPV